MVHQVKRGGPGLDKNNLLLKFLRELQEYGKLLKVDTIVKWLRELFSCNNS